MTLEGFAAFTSSNSSSCAAVLCLANTLKFVPPGRIVAPSGKLLPCFEATVVASRSPLGVADDLLRFVQNRLQMLLVLEALGIDLVHGLGARGACRKPTVAGEPLQPTDRGAIAGRAGELCDNRLPRQARCLHRLRREAFELCLLLWCRRRVDPRVISGPELGGQLTVMLPRILSDTGGDLGGQQIHDQPVLVGRPDAAVTPQKAGPGTLFAAKAARAVKQPGAQTT